MPKYKKKRFNLDTIIVGMGLDPFKDGKKRCPKCGKTKLSIESADLDRCVTICKSCHKELHKVTGYTYQDYKRKPCVLKK